MNLVKDYVEGVEWARERLADCIDPPRLDKKVKERLAEIETWTQDKADALVRASSRPGPLERLLLEAAGQTGVLDAAQSVPVFLLGPRNPLRDEMVRHAIAAISSAMWKAWLLVSDISGEMARAAIHKASLRAEDSRFMSMDDHLSNMCEHLPPAPMVVPENLPPWLVLDGIGEGSRAIRIPLDRWLLERVSRASVWAVNAGVALACFTPPNGSACIGGGAVVEWIKVWRRNEVTSEILFYAEGVGESGHRIRTVEASMLELRTALSGRCPHAGCALGKYAVCFAQTGERAIALAQQNPA